MMRRTALTPAVLIASLALVPAACSRESGGTHDRSEAPSANPSSWARLKDFTAIEATGPDNVIVTRGDFSVRAEGDQKVLDRLEIKVHGDRLEIGRKKRFGMSWSDDRGATIRVSMPTINSVDATGSGNVDVDHADGASFTADLTGSGNLKIAAANVSALKAEITGSGDLSIAGAAETADISVTGSGNFSGTGLKAGQGKVSILGSGDAAFASDGPFNINILGSGNVTVKGKAQCRQSIMGSGEARCAP
ncbi:DUF2807 domain-containing protein [Sphingobium sp. BYY-5]|uniref:head GIN domain-containing protein n=1 Tax=Sphingobium sp. BYY-5 TaxID=2926400 RepID=UPI001FA7C6F3|nr:head GIN domain-containing protein [Sphingobium sp. BYY-5]MCI4589087.1 DUF2807 domain-containing protein [Sphingobium sp. BYY-5]